MTTSKGPSRLRFMGGAALLLVLVAGGLSGAAIDRAVTSRGPAVPERDECARFRQDGSRRNRAPYSYLDLSAEQRQQVEAVLEKRKTQMDEVYAETQPRIEAIVEGARAELWEILTPEQQAVDDARREQRRAEWRDLEQRCTEQLQQEQEQGQDTESKAEPEQGKSNRPMQGGQDRPDEGYPLPALAYKV